MTIQKPNTCPICKIDSDKFSAQTIGDRYTCECSRCGRFEISDTASFIASRQEIDPRISAWIRERNEFGGEFPKIGSRTLDEITETLPTYKVTEKQLKLLRALERQTKHPGAKVLIIPETDFPLAWATSEDEFNYYIECLLQRGLITSAEDLERGKSFVYQVIITSAGWEHIEKTNLPAAFSNQAFVAMSFSPEMNNAWKLGIKPSIEIAGFDPFRVDGEPHNDRIDLRIMMEIKNSRFLIADFSQQRHGVYFEAGYALGLGIPVIWSVRSADKESLHFDTRQYNHIIWETNDDLKSQILTYITAIIGKGTSKH